MFFCLPRQRQKRQNTVEVVKLSSNPQSVNVDEVSQSEPVVHDTPTTSVATVSPPTEAPKAKKSSGWRRWLLHKKTRVNVDVSEDTNLPSSVTGVDTIKDLKGAEAGPQDASPASVNTIQVSQPEPEVHETPTTSVAAVSPPTAAPKAKKVSWWRRWLCRKTTRVKEDVSEDTNLPSSVIGVFTIEASELDEAGTQEGSPKSVDTIQDSKFDEAGPQEGSPKSVDTIQDSEFDEAGPQEGSPKGVDTIQDSEHNEAGPQEGSPKSVDTIQDSEFDEAGPQEGSPKGVDSIQDSEHNEAGPQEGSSTSVHTIKDPECDEAGLQEASSTSVHTIKDPECDEAGLQEASSTSVHTIKDPECDEAGLQEASSTSVHTIKDPERDEAGPLEVSSTSGAQVSDSSEEKKPGCHRWSFFANKKRKQTSDHTRKDTLVPVPTPRQPAGHGGCPQVQSNNTGLLQLSNGQVVTSANTKSLSRTELACLGFPNLAQTCYMNSILQGLLSLGPFIQEVHNQKQVWISDLGSQFTRGFVEVEACRSSAKIPKSVKKTALAAFKRAVAIQNVEFQDNSQKDAHEFLTCMLDVVMSQSVLLHTAAFSMGIKYTCPVRAHILFQMLSTRTCKGCGMQSIREEDHLNLSLDVVCGGSVSDCLQQYLSECPLEYRCRCHAKESSLRWSFSTLPNVLILQLKRFRFTKSFNLEKVKSPVILSRELVLNTESSTAKKTHYSLVSIISHLGSTAHSGHYICDGAHRHYNPGDMTEQWLTYNDHSVKETTAMAVCRKRQRTAYLLFYEKQLRRGN